MLYISLLQILMFSFIDILARNALYFAGAVDYGGCDYGGFYGECEYGGCDYGECDYGICVSVRVWPMG